MNSVVVPKIVDIGTVHGFCDAQCIMCPITTMKTKHIMSDEKFEDLIRRLGRHVGKIERINIVGMGETILDKSVVNKVKIAKAAGFFVGIITNGHALVERRGKQLLDAGLDEMLFSVDSQNKEVYEQIRVGLSYDRTLKNVHDFISARNAGSYRTKILVRIIVQEKNEKEQAGYVEYWRKYLSLDKSDLVLAFPEHNWALSSKNAPVNQPIVEKTVPCDYIFNRLVIDAKGNVQFCCIDNEADFFELGNVFTNEVDPVELFNSPPFANARRLMTAGRINEIDPCKFCNVPLKKNQRSILGGTYKTSSMDFA